MFGSLSSCVFTTGLVGSPHFLGLGLYRPYPAAFTADDIKVFFRENPGVG